MPLTAKGEKILAAMQEQYGEEEGKKVFYASKNAGTIEGVDADTFDDHRDQPRNERGNWNSGNDNHSQFGGLGSPPGGSFKVGDTVIHKKNGVGTVASVSKTGGTCVVNYHTGNRDAHSASDLSFMHRDGIGDSAMLLFDTGEIAVEDAARRRTADGYLPAWAKVSRVGTQKYKGYEVGRPQLDSVVLYRPEEEVFAADALRSMANKPVTLTHPKQMVDATSWAKHAKGFSGSEVVRDGDFVRVPLMLTDADTIKAFEKDGIREMSVGYTTDIDWTAGVTPTGDKYDGVQRAIRANHHALVPVARGGRNLTLGDGEGESKVTQVLVDGIAIEVADEKQAMFLQQALLRRPKLKDANGNGNGNGNGDDDTDQGGRNSSSADDEAEREKMERGYKDAISVKDGEIKALKQQLADAQFTEAKQDALLAERAAVLDAARPLLPNGFNPAGMSLAAIRRAAVTSKLGDAAVKDMDDAQITGAFRAYSSGTVKIDGARVMADGMSRAISSGHSNQPTINDAAAAYDEYVKRTGEAYRTPITTLRN